MRQLITGAVILQVFAVGTQTTISNVFTCLRQRTLIRIVLAMFVGVPMLAVVIVKSIGAPQAVNVTLGALAMSAAAPLLPRKLFNVGVDPAFAGSLGAVMTLLAIPLIPLIATAFGLAFSRDVQVPLTSVVTTLMTTFLVPFAFGMALHAVLGSTFAVRVGGWAATVGIVVLMVLGALLLFAVRTSLLQMLSEGWLSVMLFARGSLLIGHLLGGPEPGEQTALALAAVTRHPGLAALLATTNFPQLQIIPALLAVVLGYTIVGIPYFVWRKRSLMRRAKQSLPASMNVGR